MHPPPRSANGGGEWKYFDDAVIKNEIFAFLRDLYPNEIRSRWSEIKDMMEAAAAGDLVEKVDVKPVSRDPSLYELRWFLSPLVDGDQEKEILARLYYCEPAGQPGLLLALRFGQKATGRGVRRKQNAEIALARRRYAQWVTTQRTV